MSCAWVQRSIGKTRGEQVGVGLPPAGDLRGQRRRRPGVHHVGVAEEAVRLAALVLAVALRRVRRRVDRQLVLAGQERVGVVGLALAVERVPHRERDAEVALARDQPVAVEAVDPVVVAAAHVGRQPGDLGCRPRPARPAGLRRGRRCGCTTAGWRRSRAACRRSRRSWSSAWWASARRPGRRSRGAARPSPRGRRTPSCRRAAAYAAAACSLAIQAGVSRVSRPSRPITVRTGRSSSRHHVTSVRSPKVQHMTRPEPLSISARGCATTGISTPKTGEVTVVPNSAW